MRNKKQPVPVAPTPEQLAVEKHVEVMMNGSSVTSDRSDSKAEAVTGTTAQSVPINIFQGVTADRAPLDVLKTAPEIQAGSKSSKSLFSSVADLNRPQVAVTTPQAKTISLGDATIASATAISVDRLARREEYADSATDSAVADIMATEGDALLAAEDAVRLFAVHPS